MKNNYPLIMQRPNSKYSDILGKVKESYQSDQPFVFESPVNYRDISTSVQKTMQNVVATQKTFELKKRFEEDATLGQAFAMYTKIMQFIGFKRYAEWSQLFETQLNNVNALNGYLTTLVRNSALQSQKLQFQLKRSIDTAKLYNDQKQNAIEIIPLAGEEYKEKRDGLAKVEDSDPQYYEAMKNEFDSENQLMIHLSELKLVTSAHEKDLQKIAFLKRHYAFHRGLSFSAKNLAITTAQVCSSLEHLIGIYESVKPMSACLEGIHSGISNLQGYTDTLNDTYHNTFKIMTNIESSDKFDLLSLNSVQLDNVVGGMIDNLEERLAS